ncbi:hypothetical protein ceV_406 [Chrysochromulina ericina virus CeV-01B]|jgi:hypothetical protein|uniref:Uncharacterized protein n=1 Tax=Chrysochromulina ericina virus CeV-01B TaxID=3070830 RepID=A0A0N9QXS4_9VIRU|nr:hypothetical protein ceV_406 [Chrysochromulina ericina virus]ALH23312.1 hypothetical protein ceV_406 [Chrysochromulina ericina virus CeV-01B]|tara:strand:+ start:18534 stop:19031 length:498 start_codon:yes stop_codon:yes gene_type:complete
MDYQLSNNDKLQLQEMIKTNDVEDKTELIRATKHSKLIRDQVKLLEQLKQDYSQLYKSNFQEFDTLTVEKCHFLFQNYTDIYNKVLKNEINLDILNKFLDTLELIENGEVDQHEASVKVGTYLKELYVDSALKKTEKMDAENNNNDDEKNEIMEISWSEYKRVGL